MTSPVHTWICLLLVRAWCGDTRFGRHSVFITFGLLVGTFACDAMEIDRVIGQAIVFLPVIWLRLDEDRGRAWNVVIGYVPLGLLGHVELSSEVAVAAWGVMDVMTFGSVVLAWVFPPTRMMWAVFLMAECVIYALLEPDVFVVVTALAWLVPLWLSQRGVGHLEASSPDGFVVGVLLSVAMIILG